MSTSDILEIMEHFARTGIGQLDLRSDEIRLSLSRTLPVTGAEDSEADLRPDDFAERRERNAGSPEKDQKHPETSEEKQAMAFVRAPVAGVFYHASAPGEAPYVSAGQRIRKGETIGLLEAMKMISEVPADCDGIVEEILVENESFAEYGTALLKIRPVGGSCEELPSDKEDTTSDSRKEAADV